MENRDTDSYRKKREEERQRKRDVCQPVCAEVVKTKTIQIEKGKIEKKYRVSEWLSRDRRRELNEREECKIKQEQMEADNKEKFVQLLFHHRQESAVWKRQTMV